MQETHQTYQFSVAFEQSTLSEDSVLQISPLLHSLGYSNRCPLNGAALESSQQRRYRSSSNQSEYSFQSTDSFSTTATIESQKTKFHKSRRQRKKRFDFHQSKQIQRIMMKMSEIRPNQSSSSNLMFPEQRFGVDPKDCSNRRRRTRNSNNLLNPNEDRMNRPSTLHRGLSQISNTFPRMSSTQSMAKSQYTHVPFGSSAANINHFHKSCDCNQTSFFTATSPCSTCSSTSPEITGCCYNVPPPPTTVATSSHCVQPRSSLDTSHSLDVILSPFSPSTMMTPAHHPESCNIISNQLASTSRLSSLHRASNPNVFTASQTRKRHSTNLLDHCNESGVSTQLFSGNASNPSKISRENYDPSVSLSNNSRINNNHEINKVNGKIPEITPVKTGKKVQYRKTKSCPWNSHGRCVMGDQCNYAHAKAELRGRPDLTRTRLCPDGSSCVKSQCRFAHEAAQLRATGAFFRTKLCKFWLRGSCPSSEYCRHAHGEDQLRNPESIGPAGVCESPREALLLSELCNKNFDNKNDVSIDASKIATFRESNQSIDMNLNGDHLSPTLSLKSTHMSPATDRSTYQKHITESCPNYVGHPSIEFNSSSDSVKGSKRKDLNNDQLNCSPSEGLQSIFQLSDDRLINIDHEESTDSNLFAGLSDEELSVAVSDYLLLANRQGSTETPNHFPRNDASVAEENALIRIAATSDEENEMNRLVDVLTATSITSENNIAQESSDHLIYQHSLIGPTIGTTTPSPQARSECHYINSNIGIDFGLTSQSAANSSSLISTRFNSSSMSQSSTDQHHPPLMFPSPDLTTSATDLKLNDILNIAVASQDPDLLECSAKILRASLQYKQRQQQLQQNRNSLFVPRSLPSSIAASSSTTSTAVSSLPSSPRFALYAQSSLFNDQANANQSFWVSRKSE